MTVGELREDLAFERTRADRLEAALRRAELEIAALTIARDAALRVAVWRGPRRVEGGTRHEH